MKKIKPYIAKNSEDPGLIEQHNDQPPRPPLPPSNRDLLIRICEKLGVPTD